MIVAIGSDHAGIELKGRVRAILTRLGHQVLDVGTFSTESVDYPDFAKQIAQHVASGESQLGVAVCMSGNGMAIASNKIPGIRAALVLNGEMAHFARAHNDANVLALSQQYTDADDLDRIVETFLTTPFEGGRHARRVGKLEPGEPN